ncbi:MAG: nucleotidyltransferase family protein [Thermodesulfobacteriota bacterium]
MAVTIETLKRQRDAIIDCAKRHGASNVRVFGSVARGEAGSGSDVDFLVTFAPDSSLFDHGGLLMDLSDLLHCRVDVVSEAGLRPRLKERIMKEIVAL